MSKKKSILLFNIVAILTLLTLIILWLLIFTFPILICWATGNWWFMILYWLEIIIVPIGLIVSKLLANLPDLFE